MIQQTLAHAPFFIPSIPPLSTKTANHISVDPVVHGRFAEYAERTNRSVSGILNELMDIFCEGSRSNAESPVVQHLQQRLLPENSNEFQRIVRKLLLDAGFKESEMETNTPEETGKTVYERQSEWVGVVGKTKIGVKLAFKLSREPDITLESGLLFRGICKRERVILVAPYRLAIPAHVLAASAQAAIEEPALPKIKTDVRNVAHGVASPICIKVGTGRRGRRSLRNLLKRGQLN